MTAVTLRNSREGDEPLAPPTHDDGTLYPFAMHYNGFEYVAYGDSPGDLLAVLIPGYETLDEQNRLQQRIMLAVRAQVIAQGVINAEVDPEKWNALSDTERDVLNGSRDTQPHGWGDGDPMGDVWESEIPLVLVDTGYAPYTSLDRPISGIADVIDPPNMFWLRPIDEWEFLLSLARVGHIALHQVADL